MRVRRREIRIVSGQPLTASQRREAIRQVRATGPQTRARPGTMTLTNRAVGGTLPVPQMAAGGAVPDLNFQVLDDYLRGVLVAVLENMAAALPWPVRDLVEELLDVGRAPTADEFNRVVDAVKKLL